MSTQIKMARWILAGCLVAAWAPAQETPRFTTIESQPDLQVSLELSTTPGQAWRIETSTDLVDWDGWVTLHSPGVSAHTDSAAPFRDVRYFRALEVAAANLVTGDHLVTDSGDAIIHPINHASLVVSWGGQVIYVDPVGGAAPFQGLPRADVILVTHNHSDHYHQPTLDSVRGSNAVIVAPQVVYNAMTSPTLRGLTTVLTNGAARNLGDMSLEAVPAYNLTASNHPRGTGNGYVLTLGGRRLYFSGDTEDIPEMRALRQIDVAFICMNVPFTMTVAKASEAVRAFRPKVVYPYHYRNSDGTFADLNAFRRLVGPDLGIEVRLRSWY